MATKLPIGVQLYSVRKQAEKNLPEVVKAIKAMGYEGIEFAGYHNYSAPDLKKLLDDNGLKCCGTHTKLDTLLGDNLAKTAEFNLILGNPYLICPWMPPENLNSHEAIAKSANLFNQMAVNAKALGCRVGYHAHGGDFMLVDGQYAWDLFFAKTTSDVIMQMDTGNALHGKGDPIASLKKFPNRATTVHLKPFGATPTTLIGDDNINWAEVFKICETTAGTKWYIVEFETTDSLDGVRQCLQNLRKMGK